MGKRARNRRPAARSKRRHANRRAFIASMLAAHAPKSVDEMTRLALAHGLQSRALRQAVDTWVEGVPLSIF